MKCRRFPMSCSLHDKSLYLAATACGSGDRHPSWVLAARKAATHPSLRCHRLGCNSRLRIIIILPGRPPSPHHDDSSGDVNSCGSNHNEERGSDHNDERGSLQVSAGSRTPSLGTTGSRHWSRNPGGLSAPGCMLAPPLKQAQQLKQG